MKSNIKLKAYTLIEISVVLSLIILLAVIGSPILLSQLNTERVKFETENLNSLIFSTQQNAYAGKNSTAHGIKFETSRFILFEGNSFASAAFTEEFALQNRVQITNINLTGGAQEIVFAKSSFRPNNTGSLTLSDGIASYTLEINPEGLTNFFRL